MITNLKNQAYTSRFMLNQLIETNYNEIKEDNAYQISMPLMASALQGDETLYQKILIKMQQAVKTLDPKELSRKAWLLGRMLIAANNIQDNTTAKQILTELKNLLQEKDMSQDAFFAWALGYLASYSKNDYVAYKDALLSAVSAVSKKMDLTDTTWSWVMTLQAAANAEDQTTFHYVIEQMKTLTKETSLASALTKGLKPNDFPAWAFGIARLAAATIKDNILYEELEKPYQNILAATKTANLKADEMLASLNYQLAAVRLEQPILNINQDFQKTNSPQSSTPL